MAFKAMAGFIFLAGIFSITGGLFLIFFGKKAAIRDDYFDHVWWGDFRLLYLAFHKSPERPLKIQERIFLGGGYILLGVLLIYSSWQIYQTIK